MQTNSHVLRFSIVFLFFLTCLAIFSSRLVYIQIIQSAELSSKADKQHNRFIEIEPIRGTIYDRKMRPLAFNVPVYSLYANPKSMTHNDKIRVEKAISEILKISPTTLREKLDKNKYFVWLQRKIPQELADQIKEQHLPGIGFRKESKRFYPNGSLAAHIVGFASIDNKGLEGLELFYNKYLEGKAGQAQILRDARQRELMLEKGYISPVDGFDLVLTIDETIQYIAERALDKAMEKHRAKSASVIVLDVKTGEVLALVNRPTYNLDDATKSAVDTRTNRAISFVYEPGSVFKVITTAAALEEGKFNESDKIYCENGEYRIANHTLTDHEPHGTLTFKEVIGVSSNIGVAKIAQKLGPNIIYDYAKRFRIGYKTNIDLEGEVSGWLKKPSQWSKTTIGAIPIGYEVTVTPLQLVCSLAAIANDGVYMKPFVVKYVKNSENRVIKSFQPQIVDRVITSQTAQRVKEILVGVVDSGTAKKAQIEGVRVAGKTGTARKVINGGYVQGKYFASFMGFAPADNPRLVAIVTVDEPHPSYFGGTVSAPVFQEVISNSLRYLEASSAEVAQKPTVSSNQKQLLSKK